MPNSAQPEVHAKQFTMDTNVTKFEIRSLKGSTIHTKESRSAASAAELKLYASWCHAQCYKICCMPVDQLQLERLISEAMAALHAVVKCFDFEIRSLRPLRNRAEYTDVPKNFR